MGVEDLEGAGAGAESVRFFCHPREERTLGPWRLGCGSADIISPWMSQACQPLLTTVARGVSTRGGGV